MQGDIADAGRNPADLVGVYQQVQFSQFTEGEGRATAAEEEDEDGEQVVADPQVVVLEVLTLNRSEVVLPRQVVPLSEQD